MLDQTNQTVECSIAIVLSQQSLNITAPSLSSQFAHHVSLLTSRSDSQRRDSLIYLTSSVASRPIHTPVQQPVSVILPKVLPLMLDGSNGVRTQLLRFLRSLPPEETKDHVDKLLPYIRAGMTHLAADIRSSSLDILEWALNIGGQELVSCPGGWVKTLKCLLVMLGWPTEVNTTSWSSGKPSFGEAGTQGKSLVKTLHTFSSFLRAGIVSSFEESLAQPQLYSFPLREVEQHLLPKRSNAFGHLNLFGAPLDEESEAYEDREDRQIILNRRFRQALERGLEAVQKEGGEVGRAAAGVKKVLISGMADFANDS